VATELYDYQKDPDETINVVKEKVYGKVTKELNEKMLKYFENQRIKLSKN
jgi:hypothetical protein